MISNSKNRLFEKLRKKRSLTVSAASTVSPYFQLSFLNNQAYLKIVDAEGNDLEIEHHGFSGYTRKIIKAVNYICQKKNFNLNWEQFGKNHIDLFENEFLLWYLKNSDRFIDENSNPIRFQKEQSRLIILIEGETQLECKLLIESNGQTIRDFQFINETHLFANSKICRILPVGEEFSLLHSFETMLFPAELGRYLSLLYSYFENITVQYKDYHVVNGPARRTTPALLIEKVDADNSLYLKICNVLPGFEPDFLEEYDLCKVAILSELGKHIQICDVVYENLYPICRKIETALNKLSSYLKSSGPKEADYFVEDNLFIMSESLAEQLIRRDLPEMISRFTIFGSEKLKSYKVRVVVPELSLSLVSGIDYIEAEASLNIEGEVFSLFEALYQYRKNSYIQLGDGTHALFNPEYVQKLERLFQRKQKKIEVSFFDLPLVKELTGEIRESDSLLNSWEFFSGFNRINETPTPLPEIKAVMRPYQLEGYKWLKYLKKYSLGGCLADDMGLGKTLQAIALLTSIYPQEDTPSLIIIPKSLIFNWQHEIDKFSPDLKYYTYYGHDKNLEEAKKNNVIITTYGMVRNNIQSLAKELFCYVILDESQTIKNIKSQVTRAVISLRSKYRLTLSGTPIENNLGELYSLFRFLNPAMFGSLERFYRNYLFPIQNNGNQDVARELKKKIYPFIMRRLKSDVLHDLPEKIEQILYVEMSSEQKRFYEQRRAFFYESIRGQIADEGIERSQFFVLQAITELRQIASIPEIKSEGLITSPKRKMLLDNMLDSIANGHKILLFANFLGVLDYLAQDLQKNGIDYEVMTGATRNREAAVARFQKEPDCRIFLMTLKTGGQGLNLTAADMVFIYDPWWNIAAENQAVDRSHRIGQDKTVFSYKLITKGTIEEKMLALQAKKSAIFDNIISSDHLAQKFLDEETVNFFLG